MARTVCRYGNRYSTSRSRTDGHSTRTGARRNGSRNRRSLGATVVIGHAFTKDEYEDVHDDLDLEARVDDIDPDEVAARHAPVPELAERFEEAGVDYEIKGALGEVSSKVVDMAIDVDADRMVVGGRRRSPAEKAVLGSVSQEIILQAPARSPTSAIST